MTDYKTPFHVQINIYHRQYNGGTYIARYHPGSNYYIEGYGNRISESLRDLANAIESPGKDGEDYTAAPGVDGGFDV